MALNKTDTAVAERLRSDGLLDPFQHQSVLDYVADHGGHFHQAVIELGYLSDKRMIEIVSQVTGFPVASLAKMRLEPQAAVRLTASFCQEHCVFPCSVRDGGKTLWLAMSDPTDLTVRNEARRQCGLEIKPLLASPVEIRKHIHQAFRDQIPREPDISEDLDLSLRPGEEDEFKITDIAGKTMIRHAGEIRAEPAPVERVGETMFDPEGERRRRELLKLLANQEKAGRIIGVLLRLLQEKGYLSPQQVQEIKS